MQEMTEKIWQFSSQAVLDSVRVWAKEAEAGAITPKRFTAPYNVMQEICNEFRVRTTVPNERCNMDSEKLT